MDPRSECIDFINPGTGERFGQVRMSTEEEVMLARREMGAAHATWAAKPLKERARIIKEFQRVVIDATDELTAVVNQDHGKSRGDALHEVIMTVDKIHQYARLAPKWLGRKRVPPGIYFFRRYYTERVPYGVVGIIGPWNYPIDLMLPPIIAALLAGNTVVVKPSEVSAATGVELEKLFQRVPELAPFVRFVHGDGRVGAALVRSKPDLLFLTGSVKTGRTVAKMAAEDMTPFLYELGGKDPMLVLEDADVKAAAQWGVWGAFYTTGQACVSVERVYVHEKVYDEFVAAVLEETAKFNVGYSPDTDNPFRMGPLTFERQCDIVNTQLRDATQKGARVIMGGKQTGMFIEPTVLVDVDHTMQVMTDETFGPVLPIMKVHDDSHAIQMANHSYMGLSAYVWSRSLKHATRVAEQLQVGVVNINDTMSHYPVSLLPFGGVKMSGNARTHGAGEVTQFTHTKSYAVGGPPNPIDPATMVRYPGHYGLGKAILGAFFGVTRQQRVEPVVDFLTVDPKGRKLAAGTAVGLGAASVVGVAVAALLRRK